MKIKRIILGIAAIVTLGTTLSGCIVIPLPGWGHGGGGGGGGYHYRH